MSDPEDNKAETEEGDDEVDGENEVDEDGVGGSEVGSDGTIEAGGSEGTGEEEGRGEGRENVLSGKSLQSHKGKFYNCSYTQTNTYMYIYI